MALLRPDSGGRPARSSVTADDRDDPIHALSVLHPGGGRPATTPLLTCGELRDRRAAARLRWPYTHLASGAWGSRYLTPQADTGYPRSEISELSNITARPTQRVRRRPSETSLRTALTPYAVPRLGRGNREPPHVGRPVPRPHHGGVFRAQDLRRTRVRALAACGRLPRPHVHRLPRLRARFVPAVEARERPTRGDVGRARLSPLSRSGGASTLFITRPPATSTVAVSATSRR